MLAAAAVFPGGQLTGSQLLRRIFGKVFITERYLDIPTSQVIDQAGSHTVRQHDTAVM